MGLIANLIRDNEFKSADLPASESKLYYEGDPPLTSDLVAELRDKSPRPLLLDLEIVPIEIECLEIVPGDE